jgi:hypothetical protein
MKARSAEPASKYFLTKSKQDLEENFLWIPCFVMNDRIKLAETRNCRNTTSVGGAEPHLCKTLDELTIFHSPSCAFPNPCHQPYGHLNEPPVAIHQDTRRSDPCQFPPNPLLVIRKMLWRATELAGRPRFIDAG